MRGRLRTNFVFTKVLLKIQWACPVNWCCWWGSNLLIFVNIVGFSFQRIVSCSTFLALTQCPRNVLQVAIYLVTLFLNFQHYQSVAVCFFWNMASKWIILQVAYFGRKWYHSWEGRGKIDIKTVLSKWMKYETIEKMSFIIIIVHVLIKVQSKFQKRP